MLQTQEYLFRQIRERLPQEVSLADAIAELLHVSNDSAYRRIRGETPLVLEEARILCEAYGLSLDHLFRAGKDKVIFHSVRVNNDQYNFKQYLAGILRS